MKITKNGMGFFEAMKKFMENPGSTEAEFLQLHSEQKDQATERNAINYDIDDGNSNNSAIFDADYSVNFGGKSNDSS